MFSEIAEIKSIREQKSKLSEREKELTEPILTDLDMIGMLYRWFQEIISQKEIFRSGNVTQRKKFIFIILFLYSPSTLAGFLLPAVQVFPARCGLDIWGDDGKDKAGEVGRLR